MNFSLFSFFRDVDFTTKLDNVDNSYQDFLIEEIHGHFVEAFVIN